MWLLIDIGNTRIKWTIQSTQQTQQMPIFAENHATALAMLTVLMQTHVFVHIHAASVANPDWQTQLTHLASVHQQHITWHQSSLSAYGVHNHYTHPSTLGIDRWLSLIAAKYLFPQQHGLIINAGTAITVDSLDANGHFLGGCIAPSLRLQTQSLQTQAAQLNISVNHTHLAPRRYPKNTQDAMYLGILRSLAGLILQQRQQMQQDNIAPDYCLISGGDAGLIIPHLPKENWHIEQRENLVLCGLGVLALGAISL